MYVYVLEDIFLKELLIDIYIYYFMFLSIPYLFFLHSLLTPSKMISFLTFASKSLIMLFFAMSPSTCVYNYSRPLSSCTSLFEWKSIICGFVSGE